LNAFNTNYEILKMIWALAKAICNNAAFNGLQWAIIIKRWVKFFWIFQHRLLAGALDSKTTIWVKDRGHSNSMIIFKRPESNFPRPPRRTQTGWQTLYLTVRNHSITLIMTQSSRHCAVPKAPYIEVSQHTVCCQSVWSCNNLIESIGINDRYHWINDDLVLILDHYTRTSRITEERYRQSAVNNLSALSLQT
jgi:hypothetical protein